MGLDLLAAVRAESARFADALEATDPAAPVPTCPDWTAADLLWHLAQEQSGATMSADAFHQWRLNQDYTLAEAAHALGLSRRMVTYYDHGDKPIPRVVALATRGLDQQGGHGAHV